MKKSLLSLAFVLFSCLNMFSQATSMTVDCQNPGWLSSMINYGDQQTLENIKVTGYINETDLSFIGSLNTNQVLNGVINLEDVKIVGVKNEDNNIITKGYFGGHIQHLILPKSLVSASTCLSGSTLDTLTVGGDSLPEIANGMFYRNVYSGGDGVYFNKNVKKLILREGVKRINAKSFYNTIFNSYGAREDDCVLESVTFPSSLVTIDELAFQENYALRKINLPDNIEEIGEWAFANTKVFTNNDTIVLPRKLKVFHMNSFAAEKKHFYTNGEIANSGCYSNQHIYIPRSVEIIDCSYVVLYDDSKFHFHIDNENPPSLSVSSANLYQHIVIYVPKSSVEVYKKHSIWQKTTILAEPNPAQSINVDQESIDIVKGNAVQLNAFVLPEDADDKNYTWSASNLNIVSVSQDGIVTALSSGEAKVYATLNVNKSIIDSCIVNVYQPVTEIRLDTSSKSIKVGEQFVIKAIVYPTDADDKTIEWSSADETIATVKENGEVKAIKAGEVWIKAVSADNTAAKDSCKVVVLQPVTGISLAQETYALNSIGASGQLTAKVEPDDASNKEVNWKSSNEGVCVVSNGTIVAVGYGTAVVIATTVDGGFMAVCTVTVTDNTPVKGIDAETSDYKVYNLQGIEKTQLQKGINIIRFKDGTSKKVLVK